MNNKSLLKIGAFILALLLIGFILFIANSFLGNPISSNIAKSTAKKYIAEKYSNLDLKIDSVKYNFKDGGYYAFIVSEKSIDTHFSVGVRGGKVFNDSYEYMVASGQNTIDRLCKEYKNLALPILKTKADEIVSVSVIPNKSENYGLALDVAFDKDLVTNVDLMIYIRNGKTDGSSMAKVFVECYDSLAKNGYSVAGLGVTCENSTGDLLEINNVKPTHIQSVDFEETLKKAIENREYDGITTFEKSLTK